MATKLRKMKISLAVQSRFSELATSMPEFMEAYTGLEWILIRFPWTGDIFDPRYGDNTRVYVCKPNDRKRTPGILVGYTFDDDEVEILMLDLAKDDIRL